MREMPVIADLLLVALSLLAPALGGSTSLWAKALLFLLAGFLIFAHPSRNRLPKPLLLVFGSLIFLGLLGFLPAGLFGDFPWRQQLVTTYETPLPSTLSPQPFVTLESFLLMVGSLFWASYVLTRGVTVRRRTLLSLYAGGILLLTLAALFLYLRGINTELWRPLNGKFGFFPNRNHTANVLALGGIITLALAYDNLVKKRRIGWFWAASYFLIGVALVINFSRAGIVFFFLGSAAWFAWVTFETREFKRLAVGGSTLLLLLALFLIFGGKTQARFVGNSGQESSVSFRWLLQKDAARLMKDASWHGVGLGNFEPIFAGYRKDSAVNELRALHPESDWTLVGIELGFLAPLLMWFGIGYVVWKRWPRPGEGSFHLRAAATIGVLVFVVHGFVDVPGHRFGAVWPAVFLLSMTQRDEELDNHRPWLGRAYRGGAFLLCILGMMWLMDTFGLKRLPSSAAVFSAKQEIVAAYDESRHAEVIAAASRGLKIAPLDWYFYYNRGLAEAWIFSTPERAIADLSRAYYLERLASQLPYTEGRIWLSREPELAVQAWSRALQWVAPEARDSLFQNMLSESSGKPEARKWLRELARKDMDHFLRYLSGATEPEFKVELEALRREDPELKLLSESQRKRLFEIWRRKGDAKEMAAFLQSNASFAAAGWLPLAESLASRKEHKDAYVLAFANVAKPSLPSVLKEGTTEDLMRAVLFEKDFVAGYALYRRRLAEGKPEEALKAIRGFIDNPSCPKYFHYLAAEREAEALEWERAWKALHKYVTLTQ